MKLTIGTIWVGLIVTCFLCTTKSSENSCIFTVHRQTIEMFETTRTVGLVSMIGLCIIGMVNVTALPCLSTQSKAKFDATRMALKDLKNDMINKIKKLDDDMGSLVFDFQKRQWKKYNGHCYYYGSEVLTWFKAEQRCRKVGGHLAKIDNAAENKWIKDNRPDKSAYWIGLTDLEEGYWRWSYDQTLASYKDWLRGYGSKGTDHNCGVMHPSAHAWIDTACRHTYSYVCESHFCY